MTPQCPNCNSKRIDTTLNYNRVDPDSNNCRCLDCGAEFNHQWNKTADELNGEAYDKLARQWGKVYGI